MSAPLAATRPFRLQPPMPRQPGGIAGILAAGLMRLVARKSSQMLARRVGNLLDIFAQESVPCVSYVRIFLSGTLVPGIAQHLGHDDILAGRIDHSRGYA
jgi:hypothetical protein